MIGIEKPRIETAELAADGTYGKIVVEPLERGYGVTLGNSLRRILLSSLPGYAITSVKIDGVLHEFSTIPGVKEDVTEIILNLKSVILKIHGEGPKTVYIDANGEGEVVAGDIKCDSEVEIINTDHHICTLDKDAHINMELTVAKGRGYVSAEQNKKLMQPVIGVIAIDSIYTPIRNVKYYYDPYRVEQKTDYEKLTLEISTDGSIHPKDALKEAAKILIHHFMMFSDEKITLESSDGDGNEEFDEEVLHMRQLLKSKLMDMDISVRAQNCLKSADVETLAELVVFNKNDLLKFRNFGKKSLNELDDLLAGLNLSFGMDISKYKLDKE